MIVLASQSSGRLATLRAAGVEPLVHVSTVDEPAVLAGLERRREAAGAPVPSPAEQVAALARAKARDVAAHLTPDEQDRAWAVVGCDSMLEIDGAVVGKPADAAQARERWLAMRGGTGVLHTGHHVVLLPAAPVAGSAPAAPVAVLSAPAVPLVPAAPSRPVHGGETPASAEAVSSTVVRFAQVDKAEVDAYVATGEPLWCAGAFTIDGLGGAFVEGVEGDPHGVVGISLPLLRRLLSDLGIRWTDLWRREESRGPRAAVEPPAAPSAHTAGVGT